MKKKKNLPNKTTSSESFEQLTKQKIELCNLQKQCFAYNLTVSQEEWEIKKYILEMDLKIKESSYEELAEERRQKKKLSQLIENEQVMKNEILKLELEMKLKK